MKEHIKSYINGIKNALELLIEYPWSDKFIGKLTKNRYVGRDFYTLIGFILISLLIAFAGYVLVSVGESIFVSRISLVFSTLVIFFLLELKDGAKSLLVMVSFLNNKFMKMDNATALSHTTKSFYNLEGAVCSLLLCGIVIVKLLISFAIAWSGKLELFTILIMVNYFMQGYFLGNNHLPVKAYFNVDSKEFKNYWLTALIIMIIVAKFNFLLIVSTVIVTYIMIKCGTKELKESEKITNNFLMLISGSSELILSIIYALLLIN